MTERYFCAPDHLVPLASVVRVYLSRNQAAVVFVMRLDDDKTTRWRVPVASKTEGEKILALINEALNEVS